MQARRFVDTTEGAPVRTMRLSHRRRKTASLAPAGESKPGLYARKRIRTARQLPIGDGTDKRRCPQGDTERQMIDRWRSRLFQPRGEEGQPSEALDEKESSQAEKMLKAGPMRASAGSDASQTGAVEADVANSSVNLSEVPPARTAQGSGWLPHRAMMRSRSDRS